MTVSQQVFGGLRVLDLCGPSGAYAGKVLAELGADVLKVEPPGGDPGRLVGPFWGEPGKSSSLHWAHHNSSKRSVVIDLQTDAGRDRFRTLAAGADVIIDTFQAGVLDGLGLSSEALRRANPRLIHASLTPFGLTGPRKDWVGTDLIASAMGGLLFLGGMPSSPPSWPGGEQSYQIGAAALAVGVSTALLARARTGTGQRVDVSLQEATAVSSENAVGYWTFLREIRPRIGDRSFGGAKMVYRTKDGWVLAHVGGRWDALLDWMISHGADVERFRGDEWVDAAYRNAHFDEFEPYLTDVMAKLPKEQIYAEGQARRFVMGPVRNMKEVTEDIQLIDRKFWIDLPIRREDGQRGSAMAPGAPYKLSKTPWMFRNGAPVLGEDVEAWLNVPIEDPVRADSPDALGRLPLRGVRVVDFGTNVVVPMVCKTLAAFGAQILKIDSRTKPEGQRNTPVPRAPGKETSLNTNWLFLNVNSDKRSVAINMTVPEAREFVKTLIARADVVIDNFGVDPMPKWGMSPAELWALNPDLIITRCSVMGRSGPLQNYVGLGNSIMGCAGINSITGFEGDPPVSTCTAHPDYSSNAHHALLAVTAALYHRDRTGQGQLIDLSQTESTICFVGPSVLDYTANGHIQSQNNNHHSQMAPHGVFRCQGDDRWVAIACPDETSWQTLAERIQPGLAADPRFATLADRKANEAALDAVVNGWTASQDTYAVMEALQALKVPAGVVQNAQDLVEHDPHLADRKFFVQLQHEEAGEITIMQPHIKLSDTPGQVGNPAPLLGEHNDWMMNDLLGLDDEAVAMLYVEGAVE